MRFESSGRVMTVRKTVFRPAAESLTIFRWSETPSGPVYFSRKKVDEIQETGLTSGTEFVEAV